MIGQVRLRGGARLGQIPFLDPNPFPNIVPSPASAAAASAWQPTEEAKHLPSLEQRLKAGGAALALVTVLALLPETF